MPTPVTASMLYDFVTCPHRVTMDLFTDPALKDKVSPFVQLLWEKGRFLKRKLLATFHYRFAIFRTTQVTKRHGKRLRQWIGENRGYCEPGAGILRHYPVGIPQPRLPSRRPVHPGERPGGC